MSQSQKAPPGPPGMPPGAAEFFQAMMRPNTNFQDYHPVLPRGSHDERARQAFAKTLHQRAADKSRGEAREIYTQRAAPAFARSAGHEPRDREEARTALAGDPWWQTIVGLRRISQEMLWDCVIDTVEREGTALSRRCAEADRGLGSLTLDPDLELPNYLTGVDIHAMPGNYHTEYGPDDVKMGAVFDRGAYLYTHGYNGTLGDNLGTGVIEYLQKTWPEFRPARILDMGCTIGASTLPWCDAFPEAEIHAIDLAAPCLRYGYARANALGKAVHFSQQNAEQTSFPDGHFDLVVSHIMLHETSRRAIPRILAESHRLLREGGIMLHVDLPNIDFIPDLFQQVAVNQDHYDNNEPMWAGYHDMNMPAAIAAAGFAPDRVRMDAGSILITVPPSSEEPARDRIVRGSFGYGVMAAER